MTAIERTYDPIKDPRTGEMLYDGYQRGSEESWLSESGGMSPKLGRHAISLYRDMVLHDPSWSPAGLFMVPGMEHCRGGYGPTNFGGLDHPPLPTLDADHDVLEALDRWVEKGVAPERLIATQFAGKEGPQRQMPLCPYPKVAMYVGGEAKSADSFACKMPATP